MYIYRSIFTVIFFFRYPLLAQVSLDADLIYIRRRQFLVVSFITIFFRREQRIILYSGKKKNIYIYKGERMDGGGWETHV